MEHLLRKTWPRSFAYQGPDSPRFSQTHSWGSRIFAKKNPGHVVFSQTVHEKKLFREWNSNPTFRKKMLFSSFINICAHVATNNLTIANLLRKIWPWSFANHGPGYPGFSQTHPWGNQIFAKHIFGHGGFSQNMGKKIFWERSDPDLSQTTVLDIQDFRKHILGETRFSQNIFLGMAVFRKRTFRSLHHFPRCSSPVVSPPL